MSQAENSNPKNPNYAKKYALPLALITALQGSAAVGASDEGLAVEIARLAAILGTGSITVLLFFKK